jgi:hypothetical protein
MACGLVFVLLGVVCGGYYLGVGVGVAASVEVGVATSVGDWGFDGHWCMDLFVGHLPNMFWVCCLLFCLDFGMITSMGGLVGLCYIVMLVFVLLSIKHSSKCFYFYFLFFKIYLFGFLLVCVLSRFYANFDYIVVVWV